MELYIVTKSIIHLEDGHYDEETNEEMYKRKTEWFETKEKAFISYVKAAKYIRELLVEENNKFGKVFSDEDMQKWDAFFIGFHHGCKMHYQADPMLVEYYKHINVPVPRQLIEYKIETVKVDFGVLDIREEILNNCQVQYQ